MVQGLAWTAFKDSKLSTVEGSVPLCYPMLIFKHAYPLRDRLVIIISALLNQNSKTLVSRKSCIALNCKKRSSELVIGKET